MRRFEHIKRAIAKTKAGWRHWRTFREIDAGHRYQSRYHFHQRRTRKGLVSVYWRPFSLFCGPILIIMGFVFIPTPGPSYIIAIGLWLLAGEFLLLARLFDRVGARLGRLGRWIKGLWRSSPAAMKVLAVLAFAASLAYGAYTLFTG
ncbi:MAG TPA: PGPGW domain-containing protein [Rubrobacter sp.]|nr:PGPGW domain-containing protein [Rubrobacter sp.]